MKRQSMADQLVGILGPRIAAGDLAGVVTTDLLMGQYGVSRTTMREALAQLTGKGMTQARAGEGMRIAPSEQWNLLDPDVLRWLLPADEKLANEAQGLLLALDEFGAAGPLSEALRRVLEAALA